jgi:DNA-binding FadR family transcriptional regulator
MTSEDASAVRTLRVKRSRSLTQILVERFTESIRRGELRPGDRLPPESEIVAREGVSRTVVREAISRLQAAGLAETRHGIGTFILAPSNSFSFNVDATAPLTIRDVLEVLELRISLESEAAGLAAARRTEDHLTEMRRALAAYEEARAAGGDAVKPDFEFHLQIAKATGNRYFEEVMSRLGTTTIPRTRVHLAASGIPEYLRTVQSQHEAIYRAISARDAEAAQTMMRVHLAASRDRLRRVYEAAEALEPRA